MITINTSSPEGNAVYIMGTVSKLARKAGKTEEEIKALMTEMKSSSYGHLCDLAVKTFPKDLKIVGR